MCRDLSLGENCSIFEENEFRAELFYLCKELSSGEDCFMNMVDSVQKKII